MTTGKKIILGLFLSSFIGYLEWGKQSAFLGKVEYDLLFQSPKSADTFLHPFVLFPLVGQLLLLFSFFSSKPKLWLIIAAATGIALLFLLVFLVGLLSLNFKILLSVIPFLGFYIYLIVKRKKISL